MKAYTMGEWSQQLPFSKLTQKVSTKRSLFRRLIGGPLIRLEVAGLLAQSKA